MQRSACVRLSHLAQDRLDFAETAKNLSQRMSELREFDLLHCNVQHDTWLRNPKPHCSFEDKNTLFKKHSLCGQRFRWRSSSRKSTTGLVAQVGAITL